MKSEAFRDSVGLQGKEGRRGSDWWEGTALGSVHRTGIQGSRTSPLFPALCPWHWDISQWNSAVLGRRSSSQERQLPTNLASKCPSARSTHTLRGRGKRARGEHEPRRGLSAPPSFPNANSWSPPTQRFNIGGWCKNRTLYKQPQEKWRSFRLSWPSCHFCDHSLYLPLSSRKDPFRGIKWGPGRPTANDLATS